MLLLYPLPFLFADKFKVEVKPQSISLQYEDNANISCSALGKRKLKWYKVGPDQQVKVVHPSKLIDDDHYDTDGGSRIYHSRLILSIKDATRADSGTYKCIAKSHKRKLEKFVVVSVRGKFLSLRLFKVGLTINTFHSHHLFPLFWQTFPRNFRILAHAHDVGPRLP